MRLTQTLASWLTEHSPAHSANADLATKFIAVFKAEVKQLDPALLPLQQGLSQSSSAVGTNLELTLLNAVETPDALQIKAGLFYSGIIAGCSCADDPTPIDENPEYCEVLFDIAKNDASVTVTLLRE